MRRRKAHLQCGLFARLLPLMSSCLSYVPSPLNTLWRLWSVFSMPFMHLLFLLCNVASVGSSLIGVCAQFCFQDGEVFFVDGREGAPQWPTAAWAAHVAFWSVDMVHGEHCANAVGAAPFGNAVGAAVVGVARAPGRARARGFRRGDGLRSRCCVRVCVWVGGCCVRVLCMGTQIYRRLGQEGVIDSSCVRACAMRKTVRCINCQLIVFTTSCTRCTPNHT